VNIYLFIATPILGRKSYARMNGQFCDWSMMGYSVHNYDLNITNLQAQTQKVHLLQWIRFCCCKFRHFKLKIHVDEPDYLLLCYYSNNLLPGIPENDWGHYIYGVYMEDIPTDAFPPLIRRVILTHYFDANLICHQYDVLSFERQKEASHPELDG
jgi:hypothetical protein